MDVIVMGQPHDESHDEPHGEPQEDLVSNVDFQTNQISSLGEDYRVFLKSTRTGLLVFTVPIHTPVYWQKVQAFVDALSARRDAVDARLCANRLTGISAVTQNTIDFYAAEVANQYAILLELYAIMLAGNANEFAQDYAHEQRELNFEAFCVATGWIENYHYTEVLVQAGGETYRVLKNNENEIVIQCITSSGD
jgi:hypothetical protein